MALERPKGLRDFLPKQMASRERVERAFSQVFESYSFSRIATPTFEHTELFTLKSGEQILEHLYEFKDKGGRSICLRPEATAQVARLFTNEMSRDAKPIRLYYVCPMFRYEQPQKGRYREFWQAGVELLGASGPLADAEAICVASDCLRSIGLPHRLRIGHIGIIRKMLEGLGLTEKQDEIIQLLDKGELEAVEKLVADDSFMRALAARGAEGIDALMEDAGDEDILAMLTGLKQTLAMLDENDVSYEVDFGMARGLDYYTGIIFDVKVDGLGAQDQVAGGGRYDGLISLFGGPDTPAVGFAFGLDRIVEAAADKGEGQKAPAADAIVIAAGKELADRAFSIASSIRRGASGLKVETELAGKKLNKALSYASQKGIRYAIIIGVRELAEDCVMVKDLKKESQEKVPLKGLSDYLI